MQSFEFESSPAREAYLAVDFKVLRELLRLPKFVHITGVRPNPTNPRSCLIDIRGEVPREGELVATYTTLDTTVVTFDGFVVPA